MWNVFDYASISSAEAPAKLFIAVDPTSSEVNNKHDFSKSPYQPFDPEQASRRVSNDEITTEVASNDIAQSGDELPSGTDSTLFDPEAFSDLPEEWILDDWTLFGAPLSAYHDGFD
jgi:hypothetical protein